MGVNKVVAAQANMHLKVNLGVKDAQAAIAALAKKLENLEKISAIDLDVKNLKGVGDLLVQLQTLDQSMTALLENSKLAGQSLRDEMVGSINSVIDAFQHGNELSTVFLNELNEIANITDKSQIPERVRGLVKRMNQEFKGLGLAVKINADDILNLGSTKEQLNSLAGYVTKFTSTWSNGMTFAAQQTNGLVKSARDVEAEINKLLTKLNELRTVEKSVAGIINTISSGGEFKRLSKEENATIDEFAEKALNRYNEAEQRFIANQSNLEARQKAAIDMANAVKDVIRAMSYDFTDEDGGVWEIADVVDEDVSSGLEEAKNRFLSRAKEIKSLFKTEIADIEQQLSAAGIDIKTPVHVTPQKDPKAEKKIKQAVEESAPKEVEVPVKTNLNTDNTKEIVSLVEQLQKVFDIGRKKNTLEYKVLFTADGLDIRNGSFEGINSKTYAESLLSNLMSGVNVNAHSHMGKYSELTLPDIKSAIDAKKNLGINISAVIGPDDIATLDLAQVKLEDLYTLLEKLSKLPYADSLGIQAKDLNNALKEINPNYGDIFKQWKPEKFEELAKYIYNVSQATQSTIDPLEQFKSIVSFIASKDIDFSKHQGVLDSLSANNFSPDALKSAFNEIAQAEKIMSDGKILKIDVPEKSSLDSVTKSLQDQIDAYRTKRKEAGLTFEKLRKEVLMLEANHYDTKGSFIERYFHPSELDDVIKTLKSGGSVKAITEKLASEFNIEIPVKPKVDTKDIEGNYQKVLDLVNQIAAKQKEIKEEPHPTDDVYLVDKFVKDYGTLDEFKERIKEVFDEYYKLQRELSAIPSDEKSLHQSRFKELEEYKKEIAGLFISAQNGQFNLDVLFNAKQLKTINSAKSGIQDLVTQWKAYDDVVGEIYKSNLPVEQSVDSLRDSILELAKASNVSKDAWNTIVYMLYEIGDSTDLNKFATTINGLISGTITPELTILKQQLTNMFKDTDVEQLELKYLGVFDKVKEGSLTATQALEQIEKQEKAIAEAARQREEAQRKANEEGGKPIKPSGTVTGTGTKTGTGVGGTTPSSGTGTGASTGTEIADLEKLKQKVSEVELEVVKKTRAFNDEKAAVGKVVEAEMSELTKLSTKIKQVIGEVNNYSTAWTNADNNVIAVIEKSINKLVELETKLSGTINNINGIGQGSGVDSSGSTLSLYDQILEKVKQIKSESEKIKHSPDLNNLFEGAILWSSRQRDVDEAVISINTLIEKIQYLQKLDKSISMREYTSAVLDSYKEIQTELFNIDAYTRGPDAPGASTWDQLINNIKEKFLGLARFLQSQDFDIFSHLGRDQLAIIDSFNFKPLLSQLDSYNSTMYEIQSTNNSARDSIDKIANEIIDIASAAGIADDKLKDLKWYLSGFRGLFPSVKDVNQTTNNILDRAGLLYANTKEKNNEETVYSNVTDSQLSSTLETLNKTLSQFIGSNDPSSQSTDPNKGISGIADNVAQIYKLLSNPEKQSDKNEKQNTSDEDASLSKTLSALNENIARMVGSNDPASQNADPNKGLSGIADNVANIYGILNGRKDSDDNLATSIKSAVDSLNDASKHIADDAKLRKESNTKYQAASDRISTDAGRDTLFQALERQYGNEYLLDKSNVEYTGDVGGIVKIKAVLQDVNDKFYNLSATIDSQGNIVTTSIKENEKATRKYAEQEKALAKAREDAAKKAQEAVENEFKAKQDAQSNVIDESVGATKAKYEDFFKDNTINNAAIKGVQTEYQELLDLLSVKEEIYKEGKVLTDQEVADIEARCKKIQDEIDALLLKKKVVSEQRTLISDYDTKTSDVKKAVDAGDYSGSSYEDDIKNTLKEIDAEASKLQNKTKDGRMQLLSLEELEQTKVKLDELYEKLDKIIKASQNGTPKGAFTKKYDEQLRKVSGSLESFKEETKDISLSVDVQETVDKYEAAIQKLKDMRTAFENTSKGQLTVDQKNQWDDAVNEAKEYQKELEKILKIHNKIASDGHIDLNEIDPNINTNNATQMYDAMKKYLEIVYGSGAVIKGVGKDHQSLNATFTDAEGRINEVTIAYNKLNNTLSHHAAPIGQVESAWTRLTTSIGNKVREMAAYFATFGSVYEVINIIRQGINSVKEIDSALTELKKVTDETDEAYAQFLQSMSKTAGVVGSTVKDLTTMAAEWSRLGYSMAESARLAESTAILLNVSEFSDATEASEALISTMQAFQYTADESVHVVDILNEVGKLYCRCCIVIYN